MPTAFGALDRNLNEPCSQADHTWLYMKLGVNLLIFKQTDAGSCMNVSK